MKGTIKSKTDIERLFSEGRRFNTRSVVIIAMKREGKRDLDGRVAYIAGKKLGNAPQRNYAKRVMRQMVREIEIRREDIDLVFMARKPLLDANYNDIKEDCRRMVQRIEKEI